MQAALANNYRRVNSGQKLNYYVADVLHSRNIPFTTPDATMDVVIDFFPQRLYALTARLRRYKKSNVIKDQNKAFKVDEKRFNREIRELKKKSWRLKFYAWKTWLTTGKRVGERIMKV